jgi:hypothetical protein
MPPKQYQREDPDSDDEKTLLEEDDERSDDTFNKSIAKSDKQPLKDTFNKSIAKPLRGHPKGTKNVKKPVYVEPEKISEMVLNNELKLTKAQQKTLLPKKTRTITDTERARIIEMGKKGREAMIANKAKRDEDKRIKEEEERKRQELINAKKIRIERPEKKKKQTLLKKQPFKKVESNGIEVEEEEYESDSESDEGFSTDTRTIKKATKKIQQINQVLEKPKSNVSNYRDLSLLDKLNYRF